MRRLIIMRHGKSSWDNAGLSDIERPLKPRGVRDAALVGKELVSKKITPELLISSPATRAKDTAIIVAQHLSYDTQSLQIDPSIYGADVSGILRMLGNVIGDPGSIMIFGHNPTFTQLINHLQDEWLDNLPTSGCFGFDLDIDSWSEIAGCSSRKCLEIIPSKLK